MKTKIRLLSFRKTLLCIFVIIGSLFASMMFYVKTTDNMDFIRIQELMESIRFSKISLVDYLFTEAGVTLNSTLKYTFLFNVLIFVVARYFENYFVLAWISAAIDYSIICYIYYDWTKSRKSTLIELINMFFLCAAFLPFVHVVSGIRAAMAACFMALAVYKYLYKNSRLRVFAFYAFLSVSSHPYTIYAIPVALLIRFAPNIKTFVIVLFGTISMVYFVPIIGRLGIPFLSNLAVKFNTYTMSSQYTSYRSFFYSSLICAALFVAYYLLFLWRRTYKREDTLNSQKDKIYKFVICYSAVLLGSFGSYEIVCRLAYVLGALCPVISEMTLSTKKKDKWKCVLSKIIFLFILALSVYTFMKHIRYYGGHFRLDNIPMSTNPTLQK